MNAVKYPTNEWNHSVTWLHFYTLTHSSVHQITLCQTTSQTLSSLQRRRCFSETKKRTNNTDTNPGGRHDCDRLIVPRMFKSLRYNTSFFVSFLAACALRNFMICTRPLVQICCVRQTRWKVTKASVTTNYSVPSQQYLTRNTRWCTPIKECTTQWFITNKK